MQWLRMMHFDNACRSIYTILIVRVPNRTVAEDINWNDLRPHARVLANTSYCTMPSEILLNNYVLNHNRDKSTYNWQNNEM